MQSLEDRGLPFTPCRLLAGTLLERMEPRVISNLVMICEFRKEKLFECHITATADLSLSITARGFLALEVGSTQLISAQELELGQQNYNQRSCIDMHCYPISWDNCRYTGF